MSSPLAKADNLRASIRRYGLSDPPPYRVERRDLKLIGWRPPTRQVIDCLHRITFPFRDGKGQWREDGILRVVTVVSNPWPISNEEMAVRRQRRDPPVTVLRVILPARAEVEAGYAIHDAIEQWADTKWASQEPTMKTARIPRLHEVDDIVRNIKQWERGYANGHDEGVLDEVWSWFADRGLNDRLKDLQEEHAYSTQLEQEVNPFTMEYYRDAAGEIKDWLTDRVSQMAEGGVAVEEGYGVMKQLADKLGLRVANGKPGDEDEEGQEEGGKGCSGSQKRQIASTLLHLARQLLRE